jgi:transposase InsO family protein
VKADRGLTVERMVKLAGVSRASYYRFDENAEAGTDPDMDHRNEYRDLAEARVEIREFLEKVYNQKRLHSSLGYMPPPSSKPVWLKSKRRPLRGSSLNEFFQA